MTVYAKGDTIRLKAAFYTYAGVLTDLASAPSVTIYTFSDHTTVTTGTGTKESTGTYYYDYTSTAEGSYIYEFSGTLESKTILRRGAFSVGFVGS